MSDKKQNPVLDEQALERLLEAAFVLQEHNREQQKVDLSLELQSDHLRQQETPPQPEPPETADESPAKNDYTLTLAQIVETQRHIQVRHLELDAAMALVADRITAITRAAGAAIGILHGKKVRYRAASGASTLPLGTEVPMEKALCLACLRVGQVIRCADVNIEFLFDAEECRRRGIQSLIAVPVYHNGEIAGALELFFASTQAFTEQDVHSCQLMAGLITEAFARDDEVTWKKSLADERATMLDALEKLKPNLAALVGNPASKTAGPVTSGTASACPKCGHELTAREQFCGQCGSPRVKDDEPTTLQTTAAPLGQVEPAEAGAASSPPADKIRVNRATEPRETLDEDLLASLQASFEAEQSGFDFATTTPADESSNESPAELLRRLTEPELEHESDSEKEGLPPATPDTALATSDHDLTWTSAAKARETLELLAAGQNKSAFARFWNARRGDIYLAVAVILVAVVIRWGIWSNHSVSATGGPTAAAGHRRPAPDADLSLFDRMLVSMGLAEPPEAPEYRGNPETQVWIDLHTALYYCPGTDLYGKTPKGKYTTQRDAQLDQFEPAYRKACD